MAGHKSCHSVKGVYISELPNQPSDMGISTCLVMAIRQQNNTLRIKQERVALQELKESFFLKVFQFCIILSNLEQSNEISSNIVQSCAILCYLWLTYTHIYENIMPLSSKIVTTLT